MTCEDLDLAADAALVSLAAAAAGPQSVSGDAGSVTQHSLRDLIAYEKYTRAKVAACGGKLGVRLFQVKPPGAV